MSIYDPACGSGGMLLESAHHLEREGKSARSLQLFGQEMNLNTWAICKMNLFLHKHRQRVHRAGDTLRDPKHLTASNTLMKFDRVLAKPPFSLKKWGHAAWKNGDKFGRDRFGCPPKSYGDYAFVDHMIASLKPDGDAGRGPPPTGSCFAATPMAGSARRSVMNRAKPKPEVRYGKVLFLHGGDEPV
jgi:type I restriction enzyme M protein